MNFLLARKSVTQSYSPSKAVLSLMQDFRRMTNDCIRIGLLHDVSNMKKLCSLTYRELGRNNNVLSYYKLCANSKASGILASRNKSIKRGFKTKNPYVKKPILVSCYYFRIVDGKLRFPLGNKAFETIPLTRHALSIISDPSFKINSFTLTEHSLSLCISKDVPEIEGTTGTVGIDRNLRNLTVGNEKFVKYYDVGEIVRIAERTRSIVRSFARNDVRIRRIISSKYGTRRRERSKRIQHLISKDIVKNAREQKKAIVFEDIRNIRNMYKKGSGQGRAYRGMMNNWEYSETKREIEYKAAWEGVPIIHLTRKETRGTSLDCVGCGERLQEPLKNDVQHKRQLWCEKCKRWLDRDHVAVMNISHRGWLRFSQSKGIGSEAMVQERGFDTLILKVDPMKLQIKYRK